MYCLLKLLDGGGRGKAAVLHPSLAVTVSGGVGRSSAGTVGLRDLELEFPVRSSLGPTLLLTIPCSSFLKLFWFGIVPEQLYSGDHSLWCWRLQLVVARSALQLLNSGVLLVLDPG